MVTSESSVMDFSDTAQRELQSFLFAATELFGSNKTQQAGEYWFQALEMLSATPVDAEKFFRQVTIQAAYRLAKELESKIP